MSETIVQLSKGVKHNLTGMGNQNQTILAPQLPNVLVTLDLDAFDNFIRGQGVKLRHYRAMKCPVGMIDMYDTRHPHEDHPGCSNGFIYELAGIVTCQFTSNSDKNRQQDMGQVDGSTVQASAPRFYDDNPTLPVHIVPFDRFYLDEDNITVVNWQIFEHNLSGVDKMRFPVEEVESLIDSSGDKYYQNDHFTLDKGVLVWDKRAKNPGYDLTQEKGTICSIRYKYRPYWYVSSLNHEIRVAQQQQLDGSRKIQRTGQAFTLQREYVFESKQKDPESDVNINDLRSSVGPRDASFGPR